MGIKSRILDKSGAHYTLESAYEGASTGRRLGMWGTSGAGPDTTLSYSLPNLRGRSRKLVRDNPIIDGAIGSFVANLIGDGITPRWTMDDKGLQQEIQELWAESQSEFDYDQTSDFYGLQALGARSLIEGGEFFIINHFQKRRDNLVPYQIQLLEGDHLEADYNETLTNGNVIKMGIEYNKKGEKVAYHFLAEHPGEIYASFNALTRLRIPADRVIHVFKPLRIGQRRGRPWMASTIVKMHEIDQFDDATLVGKKVQAMFCGFITRPPGTGDDSPLVGNKIGESSGGSDIVGVEPGTLTELGLGEDVKFGNPPTGDSGVDYLKNQLRMAARGIGITYEQFTGDLTDVNFSSIRAGLVEFRRLCTQIQRQTIIFQMCRTVGRQWMKQAVLSGAITIPGFNTNPRSFMKINWNPDPFAYVNPQVDIDVDVKKIRHGLSSRERILNGSEGLDIEVVNREIVENNASLDKDNIILDSDPRRVTLSGVKQPIIDEET